MQCRLNGIFSGIFLYSLRHHILSQRQIIFVVLEHRFCRFKFANTESGWRGRYVIFLVRILFVGLIYSRSGLSSGAGICCALWGVLLLSRFTDNTCIVPWQCQEMINLILRHGGKFRAVGRRLENATMATNPKWQRPNKSYEKRERGKNRRHVGNTLA